MKYKVTENCYHDGIYFSEGETVTMPDGAEVPQWFEKMGKGQPEEEQVDKVAAAVDAEIAELAQKVRLGKGSLNTIYKNAGAKEPQEKLAALKEYATTQVKE